VDFDKLRWLELIGGEGNCEGAISESCSAVVSPAPEDIEKFSFNLCKALGSRLPLRLLSIAPADMVKDWENLSMISSLEVVSSGPE
jgi:hypothetical protein